LHRRLFVLVDADGHPVEEAGPAPFDGYTRAEAAREARETTGAWEAGWRVVPLTSRLAAALHLMALAQGIETERSDSRSAVGNGAPVRRMVGTGS
jgi:hypothetical protein